MAEFGYRGVAGIDYIVSDDGIFPVENNARFNGSSYVSMIVDNIEELTSPTPHWKFIKSRPQHVHLLSSQNVLNQYFMTAKN